jgi:hypothetical protein
MKLTSSNFAAACGINPYMSRQKLFRVLTGKEERDPMNDDMQRGLDNEFRAVAAAEAITGLIFKHTGEGQKHYLLNDYGTTPDGSCGSTGLEVKCPRALKDEPPIHYLPQVQGQCWIAGYDTVVFCQWHEDEGSRAWTIPRSDEYIAQMKDLLEEFNACILKDEPPKRRRKPVLPALSITRI